MANTPIIVDVINYTDTFKIWADKCNGLITAVNSTNFVVEEDPVMFLDDSRDIDSVQTVTGNKVFNADQTFNAIVDVTDKLNVTGTSIAWGELPDPPNPDAGLEVTGTTRIWNEISFSQESEFASNTSNQTIGFLSGSERYTVLAASGPFQTPKLINTGNFMELNSIHYELPDLPHGNAGTVRYGTGGGILNNPPVSNGTVYYLKNIGGQGDREADLELNGGQLTSNNLIWQEDLSDINFIHDEHQLEHYGPDGELKGKIDIPDYGDFAITENTIPGSGGPGGTGEPGAGNKQWTFLHTNSGKNNGQLVQSEAAVLTDLTNFEVVGVGTEKALRLTTFSGQTIDIADITGVSVVNDGDGNLSFQVTSLTGENHSVEDFGEIEIIDDGSGNLSLQLTTSGGEVYTISDASNLQNSVDIATGNRYLELTSLTGESHTVLDEGSFQINEPTLANNFRFELVHTNSLGNTQTIPIDVGNKTTVDCSVMDQTAPENPTAPQNPPTQLTNDTVHIEFWDDGAGPGAVANSGQTYVNIAPVSIFSVSDSALDTTQAAQDPDGVAATVSLSSYGIPVGATFVQVRGSIYVGRDVDGPVIIEVGPSGISTVTDLPPSLNYLWLSTATGTFTTGEHRTAIQDTAIVPIDSLRELYIRYRGSSDNSAGAVKMKADLTLLGYYI